MRSFGTAKGSFLFTENSSNKLSNARSSSRDTQIELTLVSWYIVLCNEKDPDYSISKVR